MKNSSSTEVDREETDFRNQCCLPYIPEQEARLATVLVSRGSARGEGSIVSLVTRVSLSVAPQLTRVTQSLLDLDL